MRSNRQFLYDEIASVYRWFYQICELWLTWKSGAIIGVLYGFVALTCFIISYWILNPPIIPGQPICDGCMPPGLRYVILFWLVLFFPVILPAFATVVLLSPVIPADILGYLFLLLLPADGMIIGAIIGYWFRKRIDVPL